MITSPFEVYYCMDVVVWTNINIRFGILRNDETDAYVTKQHGRTTERSGRATTAVNGSSVIEYCKLFIAMSGGNLDDDDDDNFLEDEEDERKGRIGGTHEEDEEEEEVEEEEWEIDEDLGLKPEVLNTLRSWPSSSPLLK